MEETILVVAEKKTLAEAVAKVLPGSPEFSWEQKGMTHNRVGKHTFVWLDGHAYEQAMPDHYLPDDVPKTPKGAKVWRMQDLPIVPGSWVLFPKEAKQRRLDKLAELLKQCDVVWHLGDPDEEGQLLVDEALEFNGYTGPVKRILVNDYNESKVKQSIAAIRDNSDPLFRGWYKWGLARSRYDWLLGLNGTRAMTLRGRQLGFDGLLPVGSVQTPLLYIVRERDRLIENFKPIPYFTIAAQLKHANGTFRANWKAQEDQLGLDESGRLTDAKVADELVKRLTGKPARITDYAKKPKEKKAPLPLAMDELQMEAFSKYGYDGQTVLAAAQKLYETYKVTSYPRSTNRYLSEAQHAEAGAVMSAVFQLRPDLASLASELDASRKSDAFDDKKMEGNPHHGIVPSIPESPQNPASWSEIERNIYDMVVRSYLAQFAAPYEYLATSIEVMVDGERFTTNGTTPVSQGWKAIYAESEEEDKGDDEAEDSGKQTLPVMAKGDDALCEKCDQKSKKTSPPPRFDDKLLIDALKNVYKYVIDEASRKRLKDGDGIGTSATRAPMIADMKERGLIVPVKEGSAKLMTSQAARALIDALPLDVKDPAQAGVFKSSLDRVSKGELSYDAFMAETVDWVSSIVKQAQGLAMTLPAAPGEACPKCKIGRLKRKEGKKGWFWFCSRWNAEPEKCDATYPDASGKPNLTPPVSIPCPTCKTGHLRRKENDKGAYWFCTNWNAEPDKCDSKFQDVSGKPLLVMPDVECPVCKKGKLRRVPGKDKGYFWGCERYKEGCKASFPDQAGKPNLNPPPKKAPGAPGAGGIAGKIKINLGVPLTKKAK